MSKFEIGDTVIVVSEKLKGSWTYCRFFRVAGVGTYDLHGSDEGERTEWDQPVYLSCHYIHGGRKPELDYGGGCYLHPDDVELIERKLVLPDAPQEVKHGG